MCDFKTTRTFVSKDMWVIGVLRLFFELLSTSVFTTRHLQTSGRLVHELNVCTVLINECVFVDMKLSSSGLQESSNIYKINKHQLKTDYLKLRVSQELENGVRFLTEVNFIETVGVRALSCWWHARPFSAITFFRKVVLCHCWRIIKKHK